MSIHLCLCLLWFMIHSQCNKPSNLFSLFLLFSKKICFSVCRDYVIFIWNNCRRPVYMRRSLFILRLIPALMAVVTFLTTLLHGIHCLWTSSFNLSHIFFEKLTKKGTKMQEIMFYISQTEHICH